MCASGRDRRGCEESSSNERAQRTVGRRATSSRTPPHAVQILCEYCVSGRGIESPHLSGEEQSDDDIPVVQMDYAFLRNTGEKDPMVSFFTMVDKSSRSMVATAVHKKGDDNFIERFLLKRLESFGVCGEIVLQKDKRTEPIDVAKHVAAERKAITIIRQTPKCRSHGQHHD